MDSVNRISEIESCGDATQLFVLKAYNPSRPPKIAKLAIKTIPENPSVAGNENYSLLGTKFCVFTSYTDAQNASENHGDKASWSKSIGTGEYNSWCGLAFERLCLLHSRQIKTKLGISGIISSEYAWWTDQKDGKRGAQIDLLIDRNDGVINLCEMKYTKVPFQIDASYEANLLNKRARFIEATQTRKAVHITMVSSQGLERNAYADEIQSEVSGGDLFAE